MKTFFGVAFLVLLGVGLTILGVHVPCSIAEKSRCGTNHEPCLNGGICVTGGASIACNCVNGYTGTTCDIPPVADDPCSPNPCGSQNCIASTGIGGTRAICYR